MLNCILVQRQTKGSEHVQNRLGRLRFASLEPNMDDTLSIFLELLFCVALVPFPAVQVCIAEKSFKGKMKMCAMEIL